jgi:hypothetical protein
MITAAGRIGQFDEMIHCLNKFYPGTMETVERLLPTYPRHVGRRVQEMKEIVNWLKSIKHNHGMALGTQIIFEKLKELSLEAERDWTVEEIIIKCKEFNFLAEKL